MEIPVIGYIVETPGLTDQEHSHALYLTSWDGRPVHRHHFSGATSVNDGH